MTRFIEKQFAKMGARVKVLNEKPRHATRPWNGIRFGRIPSPSIQIDIQRDGKGEYFELAIAPQHDIQAVDVRKSDRHLLLLARDRAQSEDRQLSKFLCGHDERSWFVAAIPETATVRNVQDAKDALKPAEVWESIRKHNLPMRQRDRRWTAAFVRQGEWFFIPRPELKLPSLRVIRNEPIRRGAGKPHMCEFLYRDGGESVYFTPAYPNGLSGDEYSALTKDERNKHRWQVMQRNAHVYVRGAIRHPDHATIHLRDWHEVVMNTETKARAMENVAFLD